jgi:gamma-glutamylcyclotransferase (GGCT)/AIG2-like uncharacterized protein YtfP
MEELPLFVYGTLQRGETNHRFLAGVYERCLSARLDDYSRGTAAHGYPLIVPNPGAQVVGELFFIQPDVYVETMRQIDLLEDLPPGGRIGTFYQRLQVSVATAEGPFTAWAYVAPPAGISG